MSERILVRGELSPWVHAGRVLGFVALLGGVAVYFIAPIWGTLISIAGGVLWIALEVIALRARWQRTWLTLDPDGFIVEDRAGRRSIRDVEVAAVTLETKRNLNNGEVSSVTRTFRVWTERDVDPVVMQGTIKTGHADPIADLIDRLHDALLARMEADLERGLSVGGDGWQLNRMALSVGRPPRDEQLPVSEITAVDLFDGKMCIWRRGQDEAAIRLPLSARNVYLLPALLDSRISKDADQGKADSATGLGRVLFQRRPHAGVVFGFIVAGVFLNLVGAALLAIPQNEPEPFYWGLVLIPCGILLAVVGVWLKFMNFRCHERGVWQGGLFGQKMLRYEDVGTFRYQAMDHYHNGIYTGTQLTMHFRPLAKEYGPAIRYNASIRGGDDDLDGLRDHVSQAIAGRMAELMDTGQPVFWTSNLQFLPEGISYRPGGLFGRKEPLMLRYDEYGGYDLQQGTFHLFAKDNPKAVCTEECSVENFFPGFVLLLMLLHSTADEQASEVPS